MNTIQSGIVEVEHSCFLYITENFRFPENFLYFGNLRLINSPTGFYNIVNSPTLANRFENREP